MLNSPGLRSVNNHRGEGLLLFTTSWKKAEALSAGTKIWTDFTESKGRSEREKGERGRDEERERENSEGGGDHILWESINAATNGCFEKGIQRAKNEESDFVPEEEELCFT